MRSCKNHKSTTSHERTNKTHVVGSSGSKKGQENKQKLEPNKKGPAMTQLRQKIDAPVSATKRMRSAPCLNFDDLEDEDYTY